MWICIYKHIYIYIYKLYLYMEYKHIWTYNHCDQITCQSLRLRGSEAAGGEFHRVWHRHQQGPQWLKKAWTLGGFKYIHIIIYIYICMYTSVSWFIFCYIILCYILSFYTILLYSDVVLNYSISYHTILCTYIYIYTHDVMLYYITLHHIRSYYTVLYHVIIQYYTMSYIIYTYMHSPEY